MPPPLLTANPDTGFRTEGVILADGGVTHFARRACEAICDVASLGGAALFVIGSPVERPQLLGAYRGGIGGARLVTETEGLVRAALHGPGCVASEDGTLLAAAAPAGGSVSAVLIVQHHEGGGPHVCVEVVLESSVRITGAGLRDRRQLAEEERRRGARRRAKLSCAIHEDVVQRMFGVGLVLDGCGVLEAEPRELCAREIERAFMDLRSIIRDAADEERDVVGDLRKLLEELPADGVAVVIDAELPAITAGQQAVACSVLAEALRNARKHASPRHVRVFVRDRGDIVEISVLNDGVRGEGGGSTSRCGVGLQLAATEAALGGGVLEHGPDGPGGWAVRLALPREERDEYDCHRSTDGGSRG